MRYKVTVVGECRTQGFEEEVTFEADNREDAEAQAEEIAADLFANFASYGYEFEEVL